ncbi:hypothetical protein SASPL_106824 [Salvia splendens]|uniref:Telomerase reverse transcriptase n=1 Tax=Salvia splendens TaxID=180675 RepID=A0A8X9A4S2_SALSN|nr:hypothetical protein SASPL_106824 [Salvia splendens]
MRFMKCSKRVEKDTNFETLFSFPSTRAKSMAPKKKKRVPEFLWSLFGNRARSLADTILDFIPPPPAACNYKGHPRCLFCSGDEAMSFLLRSTDDDDYRDLLNGCFVVVSEDAPPLPVFDHHCRCSQLALVRRTIEIILHQQPTTSNLICRQYDKEAQSSPAVAQLSSEKWSLLLKRVGDALMMYLLKHTSMFLPLPLPLNEHHQISGISLANLCSNFPTIMPTHRPQHHPPGSNYVLQELPQTQSERNSKQNTVKPRRQIREHSWQRKRKRKHLALSGMPSFSPSTGNSSICDLSLISSSSQNDIMPEGSSCISEEELPPIQIEGNSKKDTVKPRKLKREYRWQRERKRRQLAVSGTPPLLPSRGSSSTCDNLPLVSSSSQNDMGNMAPLFCNLVFQNQPRILGNAEIDRKNIFYRMENCSSMLPRKRILLRMCSYLFTSVHEFRWPNDSGASILFNHIFEAFGPDKINGSTPCCHIEDGLTVNSTCLYHSLKVLLKKLIRETRYYRHARLLEKHCSVGSSNQDASRGAGTGLEDSEKHLTMSRLDGLQSDVKLFQVAMVQEANAAQAEPVLSRLKHHQVGSFIWAICRRIIPSPLLGEPSNWRCLRRNISKFISLRRFEKLTLKECIHRLKISKFPIFSYKQNSRCCIGIPDNSRHAILECWMLWVFTHLVSPLVQANFYVTESEHEKQEVLYYKKSIWEKLMRENRCMIAGRYRLLDIESARNILGKRSFGFSRFRLLPKSNGFRMLTNLQAPSRIPVSTPSRIQPNQNSWRRAYSSHRVHRFFKSVNTVLHDVHVVLKGLREKEPEKMGSSVFDYNDVYKKLVPFLFHLKNGSISLPDVFMVVSKVAKAFDSVNHEKLLSVMKDALRDDEHILEKFTQVVCTDKYLKIEPHVMLAHQDISTASTRMQSKFHVQSLGSIVLKEDASWKIKKENIHSLLEEHIMRNMVQFRNKFYLQEVGIPQGSVLSALLGSYYYGHMERNVIFPFLEKAKRTLSVTQHSSDGTSVSGGNRQTEIAAPGSESLLLRYLDDFLFISASKRQASMFFTRLERGVRDYNCCMNKEKYGLNFTMENQQGQLSNRLHTGKDNISFLQWSGLLVNCSTLEIQADYTRFLLKAIETSPRYMNRLIRRRMYSFRGADFRPRYNVKRIDVIWLGLHAYSRVLLKKHLRFKSLLCLVRAKLKAYGEVENMSSELKYAVDQVHSSVLWSIKY